MKRVVAFVPDLMDRSRFGQAADVQFVDDPHQLIAASEEADLVVVDLGRPGVLEVLPDISVPTVGFGSHVDRDLLEAAQAAGCDQVLARSAFFSRLQQILH
jgi:hypothetical protein